MHDRVREKNPLKKIITVEVSAKFKPVWASSLIKCLLSQDVADHVVYVAKNRSITGVCEIVDAGYLLT